MQSIPNFYWRKREIQLIRESSSIMRASIPKSLLLLCGQKSLIYDVQFKDRLHVA